MTTTALAVRERPILFSGEMVRAILAGSKTQTRRVIDSQPPEDCGRIHVEEFHPAIVDRAGDLQPGDAIFGAYDDEGEWGVRSPFGRPGDRLWVRESHWRFTGCPIDGKPWVGFRESPDGNPYAARCYDGSPVLRSALDAAAVVRVPSIHMPRWASRLTLEVTDVRVERVQAISRADVDAEGVATGWDWLGAFRRVWDDLNAARGYGWDANPWVWVISFRRVEVQP